MIPVLIAANVLVLFHLSFCYFGFGFLFDSVQQTTIVSRRQLLSVRIAVSLILRYASLDWAFAITQTETF